MNSQKSTIRASGPLLFIDADDTLWENSIWYADATASFADLPELRDFSAAQVSMQVDPHDHFGSGQDAFTKAIIATYHDLVGHPCRSREKELRALGQVSRRPLSLREGVIETLPMLCSQYRLVLFTKGVPHEQEDKLTRSGLRPLIWATRVVQEKNQMTYERLIGDFGVERANTSLIGDSVASDVNPALQAGLRVMYLPNANTWSRECVPIQCPASGVLRTLSCFWQVGEALSSEQGRSNEERRRS